jgi:prolyl oligopeptidase
MTGSNPTLVYGYGGFQVSQTPGYSGTVGKLWLEQGGVYVMANIRGGGEFGPAWHQAGLKTKRQVVYDDFIAVAEDLIDHGRSRRKEKLGAMGGSNGGLLDGRDVHAAPGPVQRPSSVRCRCSTCCAITCCSRARRGWTSMAIRTWLKSAPSSRRLSPYHNVDPAKTYP